MSSSIPDLQKLENDNSVNQIYQHNYLEILNLIHNLPGIAYRFIPNNYQETNILFMSKGCLNLTGYTPQELIKKTQDNYTNLIHSEDIDQVRLELSQQLQKQHNYELEYRIITAKDEIKWVLDRGILLKDYGNINQKYLEGFISDITKQKQAEANYRGIVENALEGIFQTSISGQYLSTNPALAKIYGYESSHALINTLTDIKSQLYVNTDQRQKFIQLLQDQEVICNFESQVYRQDGSIIWISENARAVKDESGNILYYEGTVEDITERKRIKEALHFKAFYDSLTNLPNRAFLMNKLNYLLEKCGQDYIKNVENPFQFAILFLDLDRFKLINDSLGHLVGDKLLIQIARRLENCVRKSDTVSRLGGDEFTVILEEVENIEQAVNIAQRIIDTINQPFDIEGNLIYTGTSIGVWVSEKAYFLMDKSLNSFDHLINKASEKLDFIYVKKPEDLLKDADAALYSAKASGKGNYKIFDQSMKQNALEILELEVDLRQAWIDQEFEIYYQPIYHLISQKIVSLEVLLRWNHQVKGVISARKFIKILEESNLIITVEDWLLNTALNQLQSWYNFAFIRGNQEHLFKLHLNLSKKYFLQPNFIDKIEKLLNNYQEIAQFIRFEMNQSHGIKANQESLKKLDYLDSKGIELCLEDFGTKNSSLNDLYELPIQAIKIDPEFVNNIENNPKKEKIVQGIFTLADSLNIQAIAQGIETKDQLIKLQKLNCKFGQGYYFSPPITVSNIEEILDFL